MTEKKQEEPHAGARLEEYLEETHLSQTDLARMCDVSPQQVNNIIRRGQRVTEDFARAVAKTTDLNLHWLITGEGEMIFGRKESPLPEEFRDAVRLFRSGADTIAQAAKQMDLSSGPACLQSPETLQFTSRFQRTTQMATSILGKAFIHAKCQRSTIAHRLTKWLQEIGAHS